MAQRSQPGGNCGRKLGCVELGGTKRPPVVSNHAYGHPICGCLSGYDYDWWARSGDHKMAERKADPSG